MTFPLASSPNRMFTHSDEGLPSVGLTEMPQLKEGFSHRDANAHLEVDYLRPDRV